MDIYRHVQRLDHGSFNLRNINSARLCMEVFGVMHPIASKPLTLIATGTCSGVATGGGARRGGGGGFSCPPLKLGTPWELHRTVEINIWGGVPWLEQCRDQIIYPRIFP